MNTPDDTAGNGALTPEERALAQRLARLGAQAEPSSALDARILAAAHAAAAAPPPAQPAPMRRHSHRRAQRRPVRWPTVFGFAASLALALGIAWQLRPVPGVPAQMERAASAGEEPLATYKPPAPAMSVRVVPQRPLNIPAPPPAERPPPSRRAVIRDATPADAERKPQAFEPAPQAFLDEAVTHEQAAPAAAPPPPADTAAVAPPRQQQAPAPAAPAAARTSAKTAGNAMQREADAAQHRRETRDAARDAAATQAREPAFAESDEDLVPPATADSPEVRDAWLQRIRELVHAGDADAARESLRAFRARYPRHVLPDDLRALEE